MVTNTDLQELARGNFSDQQLDSQQQSQQGSGTQLHNQGPNILQMNRSVQQAIKFYNNKIQEKQEEIVKLTTQAYNVYEEAKDPSNLHLKQELQDSHNIKIGHIEKLKNHIKIYRKLINIKKIPGYDAQLKKIKEELKNVSQDQRRTQLRNLALDILKKKKVAEKEKKQLERMAQNTSSMIPDTSTNKSIWTLFPKKTNDPTLSSNEPTSSTTSSTANSRKNSSMNYSKPYFCSDEIKYLSMQQLNTLAAYLRNSPKRANTDHILTLISKIKELRLRLTTNIPKGKKVETLTNTERMNLEQLVAFRKKLLTELGIYINLGSFTDINITLKEIRDIICTRQGKPK